MSTHHRNAIGGIYAIRHVASGKMYIGSAVNIFKRWGEHRRDLTQGGHHSRHLQRAWDRHGSEAFAWEVLEIVEDPADLIRIEQEYLDRLGTYWRTQGYNINPTAGSALGTRASARTRAKMSATRKGRPFGPEVRSNRAALWADPTWAAEVKAKMSAAQKAKELTPEHRARISAALKGRGRSPEHLAKIVASNKNREFTADARARISAAGKGRKHTPETRAKMSAAQQGRKQSPEHRASISAGLRGRKRAPSIAPRWSPRSDRPRSPHRSGGMRCRPRPAPSSRRRTGIARGIVRRPASGPCPVSRARRDDWR